MYSSSVWTLFSFVSLGYKCVSVVVVILPSGNVVVVIIVFVVTCVDVEIFLVGSGRSAWISWSILVMLEMSFKDGDVYLWDVYEGDGGCRGIRWLWLGWLCLGGLFLR